ncbi:MAG: methyltransferase domain-containing protein [Candidatus Odinarchaeota archaeon]
MHPRFLSFLCCPKNGCELHLSIEEYYDNGMVKTGTLNCVDEKRSYPIISGIPRFVKKELYSSSFGYEWKKWPRVQFEAENIGKSMQGYTTKMFKKITHFKKDEIKGKKVLEYGCGSGRFLDVVRSWGGIAVGIDLSLAVESARMNFQDDVNILIIQGDILQPPFKKEFFDFGYSIGVLHHIPTPEEGFRNLCELIKEDGRIACSVYFKKGFYNFPSVLFYRKCINTIKKVLNDKTGNLLALLYSYFSSYILYHIFSRLKRFPIIGPPFIAILEKYLFVNVNISDKQWRLLDIFDAITPYYASTHTHDEVKMWFKNSNCIDIKKSDWGPTSFNGRKMILH